MEVYIHNSTMHSLPYEELKAAFNGFAFTEKETIGSGQVKKHLLGVNKYGTVVLNIQKQKRELSNTFRWEVSEKQIPILYFDAILSTLKDIMIDKKDFLDITITDGSSHDVDSSKISFEIATFMAVANMIGFEHDSLMSYQ